MSHLCRHFLDTEEGSPELCSEEVLGAGLKMESEVLRGSKWKEGVWKLRRGAHKATLGSEPVLSLCGGEGTGRRERLECRESDSCAGVGSGTWRHAWLRPAGMNL